MRAIILTILLLLAPVVHAEGNQLAETLQAAATLHFGFEVDYRVFRVRCDSACRRTIVVGKPLPRRALIRFFRAGTTVPVGYGIVDNVMGKEQPITYLLLVDRELSVRGLEILAYRENRGGEIRRQAWRAQFVGRTPEKPPRLGTDVANIAGATISSRSVTDGVARLLVWLRSLKGRNLLP